MSYCGPGLLLLDDCSLRSRSLPFLQLPWSLQSVPKPCVVLLLLLVMPLVAATYEISSVNFDKVTKENTPDKSKQENGEAPPKLLTQSILVKISPAL